MVGVAKKHTGKGLGFSGKSLGSFASNGKRR